MATGETKLSYLDVVDDIQDGDTVPILRDGKNYMSKGLAQINADLTDMKVLFGYVNGGGGSISFSADIAIVITSYNASNSGTIFVCRNTYVNTYESSSSSNTVACESTSTGNFTLTCNASTTGSRLYYFILGINLSQTSTT